MGEPVTEFKGNFSDILAITELRGSYPNVPYAAGVDYSALIAGDENPVFLTLPIGKANVTSGNNRHYDEAFVQELERQTLALKPVGLMGHLSDSERATAFPAEAVHWVGAIRDGDTLWGKGYIPPGPVRDRIQRYKAQGKSIATSIDAFAEGVYDIQLKAMRMSAKSLRLNQIDIAPADRAGIPDLAVVPHLTTEMQTPQAEPNQEPEMDRTQMIQELMRVAPRRGWMPSHAPELAQLEAIRETLGVNEEADVVKLISELKASEAAQAQAAITSRITELVSDPEKGVKVEAVRGLVRELVSARQPKSLADVDRAYGEVLDMASVKETLAATVQRAMGPRQGTPLAKQKGAGYFTYPQED